MDLTTIEGAQALLDTTPIHRWLGFRIVAMDRDRGTLSIEAPAGGNALRSDGAAQAHGGAIATLIDSTSTFAYSVMLGRPIATMNMRVDFVRPATGETMTATATVRRAGRTVAVVDVELEAGGKLVALGRCVQATGS